ncbi:MAG TPA: tetratricopeptide repeat protein [Longimicrobium sp.]|nr:tetratricopeptide repeat protein [Longimicrobium sp.]
MIRAFLVVIALSSAGCADSANARYRQGEVAEAAALYARAVERGDSSPEARYNVGTARLRLRQFDAARPDLESAASAAGPADLVPRAHYNAGNADLEPAFADSVESGERSTRLRRAVARYQRALLLAPGDTAAKWNLELAQRLLAKSDSSGGGGGGAEQDSGAGGAGEEDAPEPSPSNAPPRPTPSSAGAGNPNLSPGEAERILADAERDERELQRRKLRQAPQNERAARDW